MAFRIGVLLVIGGILASITVGIYAFESYKTVPVYAIAGQSVQVGPVSYVIVYDGLHDGNDLTRPENAYYQIGIIAENTGLEQTRISNSQFSLTGPGMSKTGPIFSNFSDTDLSGSQLEPGQSGAYSTQFDIQYEEGKKYVIQIRPTKEQSSTQIGIICMSECS